VLQEQQVTKEHRVLQDHKEIKVKKVRRAIKEK
jgi:hypothetical protein